MTHPSAGIVCTVQPHHQRGAAVFSAQASDLGLAAGLWPATLLCHLPAGRRAIFRHAWCDHTEQVHCYTSAQPFGGLTLILHAPLAGLDLDGATKECV